jgi:hypothetical protein
MILQFLKIAIFIFFLPMYRSLKGTLSISQKFNKIFKPFHQSKLFSSMDDTNGFDQNSERSTEPSRRDNCLILISGMIGGYPRENYLSNGHYVVNFGVSIILKIYSPTL